MKDQTGENIPDLEIINGEVYISVKTYYEISPKPHTK